MADDGTRPIYHQSTLELEEFTSSWLSAASPQDKSATVGSLDQANLAELESGLEGLSKARESRRDSDQTEGPQI